MKYSEIVGLLDKGFTPEQIMALHDQPAPAAEYPASDPEAPVAMDVPETKPATVTEYVEPAEPEWAKKLNENITAMKNAIYAQNIQKDMSGGEQPKTAEQTLLDIMGSGGKKG